MTAGHNVIVAAFFNGPDPDGLEVACKTCNVVLMEEREVDTFVSLDEIVKLKQQHLGHGTA